VASRVSEVPNSQHAQVDPRKIQEYLLSQNHPVGKNKARFFLGCGYDNLRSEQMIRELKRIVREGLVVGVDESHFGIKYVVEGGIHCTKRPDLKVRTVWIIEINSKHPRFVTAYPL